MHSQCDYLENIKSNFEIKMRKASTKKMPEQRFRHFDNPAINQY